MTVTSFFTCLSCSTAWVDAETCWLCGQTGAPWVGIPPAAAHYAQIVRWDDEQDETA